MECLQHKPTLARRDQHPESPLLVNRCAITLRPKQPYIDWANSLEPGGTRYEDDDGDEGEPVFLGPDVDFNEEARTFVLENFDYFFEFYLEQWWLDESQWPAFRTREMFLEWFEITISSMVEDVVDGPLTAE